MKIQQKLVTVITMLLIMSGGFSALEVKADDRAPMFNAYIEYTFQGYVVMGVFTEFSSDVSSARPMYSLDGENWHMCAPELEWDLHWMDMEGEVALKKLQTQVCLYDSLEPLSSYLAGELDCFYLKLCLTRGDGSTYETQSAVIERDGPQPLPQDFNAIANFDSSVFVSQRTGYYGRYQLTISADATAEDITALLPDTLPVEIQFQKGNAFVTKGIVDYPVTWKPLILPQLIAGDSVTILDAAEEIVIPGGTLVNTPLGIFELNAPLRIDQYPYTDEVRLVLNVVSEDEDPTGVLVHEREGLEMAFDLKPTGATAIHAYTFSDDTSGWVELPGLSLLETVNSYPSAANSGYALVVGNDSELFQRYLAAKAAGEEPVPFYVGLRIEGGVYDGRQLILVWPDTYHAIPSLPKVGGCEGNEGNAGVDNKGDSTEGGQRPNLPQDPAEVPEGEQPERSLNPVEVSGEGQLGQSQDSMAKPKEERLNLNMDPDQEQFSKQGDDLGRQRPDLPLDSGDRPKEGQPESQITSDTSMEEIRQAAFLVPGAKTDIQMSEKTDSNTKANSDSLTIPILLMMVIAISGICLIVVIGKRAAGRKS